MEIFTVAIWDARHLFKAGKPPGLYFNHNEVASLPRLQRDLEFGEIALVYYSASSYVLSDEKSYSGTKAGLSLNLYGVVLLGSEE